ncbi:MAG: glycosyltransferase family 39 protein, partial [Rhodospirillales bacterium]|nr:glycosyltransferase family 39 protein [Rhodospirillales bacterium]
MTVADRDHATARLLLLLAGFVLVWTLYFAITEAPVAIKHDMAEAYAWGRQFELGYNQHPPFWAWVCGAWFRVLPRTLWAFALLSALNAAIGLWGAWAAIGDFATGATRRAAFALLLATPLYTVYAYKYDANTIVLSIWPWTIHGFVLSLRSRRTRDALGFGIGAGLALMSKYYALVLLFSCFVAALLHPARRRYFASAAPYVSVLTALALLSPHLWWLATHRAPPLRYLHSITDWPWSWILRDAWQALGGIVGMNAAPVALAAWFAWRGGRAPAAPLAAPPDEPAIRLLAVLTLLPPALTLAAGLALRTRIKSEMMLGVFPLLPLLAIALARPLATERLAR